MVETLYFWVRRRETGRHRSGWVLLIVRRRHLLETLSSTAEVIASFKAVVAVMLG